MSSVEQARRAVEAAIHADYEVSDERFATRFRALDAYALAIRAEERKRWEDAVRVLLAGPAVCDCDEAYTKRGRHEPNAVHDSYSDVFDDLRVLLDYTPPAAEEQ